MNRALERWAGHEIAVLREDLAASVRVPHPSDIRRRRALSAAALSTGVVAALVAILPSVVSTGPAPAPTPPAVSSASSVPAPPGVLPRPGAPALTPPPRVPVRPTPAPPGGRPSIEAPDRPGGARAVPVSPPPSARPVSADGPGNVLGVPRDTVGRYA